MYLKNMANMLSIVAIFYIIGKLDFTVMHPGTVLVNRTDNATFHKYKESQNGFTWTHGMTRRSNVVSISAVGTREKDQKLLCNKYRILATGSSSGFGSGLKQDETWSAYLNSSESSSIYNYVIYNSSNPGWGPYHWANYMQAYYDIFNPDLMLVMLSYGDFTLYPKVVSESDREEWLKRDRIKKRILNFDNFGAYSLRKLMYITENFAGKYETNKVSGNPIPLGFDMLRIAKHLGNHMGSLEDLVDYSERKKANLIFFLRKSDETDAGNYLFNEIGKLTELSEYASAVQVNADSFRSDMGSKELSEYYQEHFVLKNDTHPNERYSRLIADVLSSELPLVLNELEIKNNCDF